MSKAPRIPVIIGIGEIKDRPQAPELGLEPLAMLEHCLREADRDAGGGWLARIDTLRVVNQLSWPYRDLPALLAKRLRLRAVEGIYGPLGGESPVRMLVDSAADIASGHAEVAVLCGAEATRTAMQYAQGGAKPAWADADETRRRPQAIDFVSEPAYRYGLAEPVDVYPLYENACRAAWGQSLDEAQRESAECWAGMSAVAAENPYAWSGQRRSVEEIVTASAQNRPIAYPYLKYMVAQIGVNQGCALLLTHVELARELGVPDEQLVYVGAGAGGSEPTDFLQRGSYKHAPAMERVLNRTLELNRVAVRDIDLFELYSCFPCVPKLARRALALPEATPISVTGGLSFFGGPTNNYMGHAATAMVRALRARRGATGLLYGNGEFVTKHHATILATSPPVQGVTVANTDLQADIEASRLPAPELIEDYAGPCTIETYTVTYKANGEPDRGVIVGRTPEGKRLLARVTEAEPDALALLLDGGSEAVGAQGVAYDGGDGWQHWALRAPETLPEPVVLFERLSTHIALITLNRPAKRNTVNGAVTRLMSRYVQQVEDDPDIRAVILTGAGDKAFCAGADLAEAAAGRGEDIARGRNGFAGFVNAARRKPWIAAVRGFAVGGGTELTLACDLAVAGNSAVFGLPEVKRSLIAGAGGVHRLPRAIAPRVAAELILTGATIDAKTALALHLVNRCVADADVVTEAMALAEKITANAPLAVQASRQIAGAAFDRDDRSLSDLEAEAIGRLAVSDDFKEGSRAFLEKRDPKWNGT